MHMQCVPPTVSRLRLAHRYRAAITYARLQPEPDCASHDAAAYLPQAGS